MVIPVDPMNGIPSAGHSPQENFADLTSRIEPHLTTLHEDRGRLLQAVRCLSVEQLGAYRDFGDGPLGYNAFASRAAYANIRARVIGMKLAAQVRGKRQ